MYIWIPCFFNGLTYSIFVFSEVLCQDRSFKHKLLHLLSPMFMLLWQQSLIPRYRAFVDQNKHNTSIDFVVLRYPGNLYRGLGLSSGQNAGLLSSGSGYITHGGVLRGAFGPCLSPSGVQILQKKGRERLAICGKARFDPPQNDFLTRP